MTQPPAAAGGRLLDVPGGMLNGGARGGDVVSPGVARESALTAGAGVPLAGNAGEAAAIPAPPEGHRVPGHLVMPPEPAAPANGAAGLGEPLPGSWPERIQSALGVVRGQLAGGTEADQFGFDPEFSSRVLIPLARLFYQHWFRVRMRGLEHVPAAGPALVVANHSGTLPMDAIMLQTGLHDEHPAHRNLRLLGADLVYDIPLLANIARKGGHARACPADAHQLLRMGELVGVFPEGFKGIGKPFGDRYQLRRFGRGGFAVTAMRARVPIVPCAIVGAEEIYPLIGNFKPLARLLGLPYFPVTPLFPWLGPIGAVPLPSRWIIEFCPPVPTDGYAPGDEHDPAAVADLSGRVRGMVQRKLDDLLDERGPAFG